jgi:transposase InsO family protein
VNRSGYYKWLRRSLKIKMGDESPQGEVKTDSLLGSEVKKVFDLNKRRSGSRRVRTDLLEAGFSIGRRRVIRLMREQGLKAIQPRSFVPKTTDSRHGGPFNPNLLIEEDFVLSGPLQALVGDITYLPLAGGLWCYLAFLDGSVYKKDSRMVRCGHYERPDNNQSLKAGDKKRKPVQRLDCSFGQRRTIYRQGVSADNCKSRLRDKA